jgi:hypothetical protein
LVKNRHYHVNINTDVNIKSKVIKMSLKSTTLSTIF